MANSPIVLRDSHALLDPAAETAGMHGDARSIAAFHLVGGALLRSHHRDATAAAVEVFRIGTAAASAEPSLRNSLGAALLQMATFASHAVALDLLTEAERAFRSAASLADSQKAPHATRIRYAVNLATSQWLNGERRGDSATIRRSLATLRSIASELSPASAIWPHVLDNIGNALMALGRSAEAIPAYETALETAREKPESARLLNNLGTAHAAQDDFAKAVQCHREALLLLSRDTTPIAWGLAQHNLGSAVLQDAMSREQPEREGKKLRTAVKALETAAQFRSREQMPLDWAVTTVNLAAALVALGTHLCATHDNAGLAQLRKAIGLYQAALPELMPSDASKAVSNAQIALQILGRLSPDSATHAEIRQWRTALLATTASPPGWPEESYAEARNERNEDIVQFLSRVWLPLIQAGGVDLRTLRAHDPSAAKAIENYQQRRDPATGQRRRLPAELDIPTRREVNDRLAAANPSTGDRPARLDWALRSRARRKRVKEKT